MGTPAVDETLKRRGARRLVYCHCDHFEPWRSTPRSIGPENAALVEDFARTTAAIEEARRLTLFYRAHCKPVLLPRAGAHALEGEAFGLVPLDQKSLEITAPAIRSLVDTGHELQLHIHHERITANSRYALATRWADDLAGPEARARDSDRLRLLIRLSLETVRAESGLPFDRWLFIHGNWALAASDPEVCQVEDELHVLHELGCTGDFTFSGEPLHDSCNPAFEVPSLVRPVIGAKAYDLPEADARPALRAGSSALRDRLFVWSSSRGRIAFALDYTNPQVQLRCANPITWAEELAKNAIMLGETLYILTYGHSMSVQHGELGAMLFPHAHPAVRSMFGNLFDAAAGAGLDVAFLTASEVMDEILRGA